MDNNENKKLSLAIIRVEESKPSTGQILIEFLKNLGSVDIDIKTSKGNSIKINRKE